MRRFFYPLSRWFGFLKTFLAGAQRAPTYNHLIYLWVFPLWLWGQTIIAQQPPLKGYFQPTSLAPRNSSTEKQPLVCRFPFACNCIIYTVYVISTTAHLNHLKWYMVAPSGTNTFIHFPFIPQLNSMLTSTHSPHLSSAVFLWRVTSPCLMMLVHNHHLITILIKIP